MYHDLKKQNCFGKKKKNNSAKRDQHQHTRAKILLQYLQFPVIFQQSEAMM